MNIGWIGTGNMGVRMAERLAKAGHKLYVYNRTKEKAQRVLDAGDASLVDSPAQIAKVCDIFFTSVTNDDSMREILHGPNGLLGQAKAGQVLVEMSTLSTAFSEQVRKDLHAKGLLYLVAPVVGSMFMIEQGLLKILASGDEAAYQTALPYLNDIGRIVVPLGDKDQARNMKIAVNMIICSYLTMYGEILSVGEGMGFGWDELNELLEQSDGASPMLCDKGTTHRDRCWGSSTALTSTAMKDLGLALEMAQEGNFALPLTSIICQYDRYMYHSKRYGTYSTFGTIGVLEDWCGKGPGEYRTVPEDCREKYVQALSLALIGMTTLLAREAIAYCRNASIDSKAAEECLSTCHGATIYFKKLYLEQLDNFTFGEVRGAFRVVLNCAKEAGLFVPILAIANEQLNQISAQIGVEKPFGSVVE